jgi:hypothetical protein
MGGKKVTGGPRNRQKDGGQKDEEREPSEYAEYTEAGASGAWVTHWWKNLKFNFGADWCRLVPGGGTREKRGVGLVGLMGAVPRTRVRGGQSDSVENIDSLLDWRRVPNERSKPATWRNQTPDMREQEAFQLG